MVMVAPCGQRGIDALYSAGQRFGAPLCVCERYGVRVCVSWRLACAFAVLFRRDQVHIVMVTVVCRGVVRGA